LTTAQKLFSATQSREYATWEYLYQNRLDGAQYASHKITTWSMESSTLSRIFVRRKSTKNAIATDWKWSTLVSEFYDRIERVRVYDRGLFDKRIVEGLLDLA